MRKEDTIKDPYDLERFLTAQAITFQTALEELQSGQKRTHWIWFIFPQLAGLGRSETSKYYGIKSPDEARQYLAHPLLGTRLVQSAETVLSVGNRPIHEILPPPDDKKLQSSMTLFELVAGSGTVFSRVLDQCFSGKRDKNTEYLFHAHTR
jgi:uncharacterized protein (DUF1810 family)